MNKFVFNKNSKGVESLLLLLTNVCKSKDVFLIGKIKKK